MKTNSKSIYQYPKISAFLLGLVVAIVATALETFRLRYANYLVYADSTLDFWHGINPYTQDFIDAHGRYFLYTPVFSVLYLPIAILPKWLGPFVWNLCNYTLFALSVFTLPKQYNAHKLKIFLSLLLILEQSIFPFQFNIVVAYCFLFAYSLLERGKAFWAVLLIMISTTTKVYGIVELLLLFCYQKPFRNLCYAAMLGVLLLMLPALKTGFDGLLPCYENWWQMLSQHQSSAYYVSLLYAWPLRYILNYYRLVQLVSIGFVVFTFFWQYRRWPDFLFRATVLGVLMGWIIVFGDSSETHTYLIALTGYMLWYSLQKHHTLFDKILFWAMIVFFGIIPIDLFVPSDIHHFVNGTLYMDVYLFSLAWGKMCLTLWRTHDKDVPISTSCSRYGLKALVIHATKLKERGEHVDRMLRSIGMDYEFIREADLDDLSRELLCKYFTHGEEMADSPLPRYSCATKHFLALERIVTDNLEGALVLEDDIVLHEEFTRYFSQSIQELHSCYANRPAMISYEDSSLQFVPRSQRKKGQLLYPGKKDRMAGAYYMSRTCAETILADLKANKCPTTDADTYHYDLLKRGVIEYLWCQPALATQGSFTGAFRSSLSSKKDRMIEIRWWFKKNYKRLLYWLR